MRTLRGTNKVAKLARNTTGRSTNHDQDQGIYPVAKRKLTLSGGRVRLKVQKATIKSIKSTLKTHRKRILKAQKLRRRKTNQTNIDDEEDPEDELLLPSEYVDLEQMTTRDSKPRSAALRLKCMSTDSDELEVDDQCSEEDQEEAVLLEECGGCEVDSGCDEWDLSKDITNELINYVF